MEKEIQVIYQDIKKESYKPSYEYFKKREEEYRDGGREYGWNKGLAIFGWVYYAYKRTYGPALVALLTTAILGIFGGKYGILASHFVWCMTGEAVYITSINKKIMRLERNEYTEEEIKAATRPNILIGAMALAALTSLIFMTLFTIFMLGTA